MLEQPSADPAVAKHLKDRLYIDSSHETGCAILTSAGLLPSNSHVEMATPIVYVPDYTGEGGWRHRTATQENAKQNLLQRVQMALFGGVAVVAPMLIMVLHKTQLTALVTTSVFVVAVGLVLAWVMREAAQKDIMTATAAYAAVLVVFVGANG